MNSVLLDSEDILRLYKKMVQARLFEEKAAELYTQGHISGFCHLYIGQEAVIAGVFYNMKAQDSSITSYRDHAHMLTFGVEAVSVMAELCGKAIGCSKGKGGSMHMYSKEHNFYGGNGIVGAQVPLGAGLAFAHKYKKDGGISWTFFGDGAANQGQVYETFNMASLWKLPVVFVLENNHYAMGTAARRAVSGESLKTRGEPFGIRTILVDGMNLFDVIEKSKEAEEFVRSGNGPIIMHVDTYRYRGHSMSDPATYRTREEVDNVKKTRDPIIYVRNKLIDEYKIDQSMLDSIDEEIADRIEDAANEAIKAPFPDLLELETDVIV
ncbi:MAG: pyruvate dehydrogenase (acetyl-transferring) E1 component subunit alpha [Alphaproteobacteria bacterium]|nr:pyruvate dehydrogenase (acetyl-transferring) E1 component subunit alpha [Alphaproteobacteria bacterium]